MRRKHGGRESGGGDAESERDGAIRTTEGKWACRDRDKLRRGGRREIRTGPRFSLGGKKPQRGERECKEVFCGVPARRKCQWSLWEPARPRKRAWSTSPN